MILGYRVEDSSSGKSIRDLLQEATLKYKPNKITFLTDGGSENVNTTVSNFLDALAFTTKHIIAQKDVVFSNSKCLFLKAINESVTVYNTERPQIPLSGNTPFETFNGIAIDFGKYKTSFVQQKVIRLAQNKQNSCKICF